MGGFSLMGGNTEIGAERTARPGAPVIRLHAWNLMGRTSIFRVRRRPEGGA